MERALFAGFDVLQRLRVLELLACEDQSLVVGRAALLELDQLLQLQDGHGACHGAVDGSARERLHASK